MKKFSLFDKKGGFSIIYVIAIFVAMLIAIGFMDILSRSYHMDEIQSSMDIAGISALQTGVDETKLRVEVFEIDEHVVKSNYKKLIRNNLDNMGGIVSYKIYDPDVDFDPNSTYGLGSTSKGRPQAVLDSTVVIVVENSQMFDLIPGAYETFYDSKDGKYIDVKYNGTTEDGKVELIIRSVTRIVYR